MTIRDRILKRIEAGASDAEKAHMRRAIDDLVKRGDLEVDAQGRITVSSGRLKSMRRAATEAILARLGIKRHPS